ncbi:unnamed protein product [Protopolystoma xenopodis]|uniref:Uncharacterized protein n=1 Tax=Protopolystoma xenopodis TaxID=117903 RepID=A0A448X8V5_9PLAT|nr:unnamed protein product [Protopolystoma xenopodis]
MTAYIFAFLQVERHKQNSLGSTVRLFTFISLLCWCIAGHMSPGEHLPTRSAQRLADACAKKRSKDLFEKFGNTSKSQLTPLPACGVHRKQIRTKKISQTRCHRRQHSEPTSERIEGDALKIRQKCEAKVTVKFGLLGCDDPSLYQLPGRQADMQVVLNSSGAFVVALTPVLPRSFVGGV